MAGIVDDLLSDFTSIPGELATNYGVLKKLDAAVAGLGKRIRNDYSDWKAAPRGSATKAVAEDLEKAQRVALTFADQKIALADHSYDALDNAISKLDGKLKVVESVLRSLGHNTKQKRKRRRLSPLRTHEELPINPHEPVYCSCRQVAFGQMIACDNPTCTVEWFHYQCVGLAEKPAGKWLCPDCR